MEERHILTSSDGLTDAVMLPFRESADRHMPGAVVHDITGCAEPFVVGRVFRWLEILQGLQTGCRVLLADGRDQFFQSDLFDALPDGGLHAFAEHAEVRMGGCPYNDGWMRGLCGDATAELYAPMPVLCVGTVLGGRDEVMGLLEAMAEMIDGKAWFGGMEQAAFQHAVWSGKVKAEIHANEAGPVYTVGYIPRETVRVTEVSRLVVNATGKVPAAVHQWDRHANLRALVAERWGTAA